MFLRLYKLPGDHLQVCNEGCELLKSRSVSEGASTILGELKYRIGLMEGVESSDPFVSSVQDVEDHGGAACTESGPVRFLKRTMT